MNYKYEPVRISHSTEIELQSMLISVASLRENQSMKNRYSQFSNLQWTDPTSIKCVRCFRSSSNRNHVASNPAPKFTIYIQQYECWQKHSNISFSSRSFDSSSSLRKIYLNFSLIIEFIEHIKSVFQCFHSNVITSENGKACVDWIEMNSKPINRWRTSNIFINEFSKKSIIEISQFHHWYFGQDTRIIRSLNLRTIIETTP